MNRRKVTLVYLAGKRGERKEIKVFLQIFLTLERLKS